MRIGPRVSFELEGGRKIQVLLRIVLSFLILTRLVCSYSFHISKATRIRTIGKHRLM